MRPIFKALNLETYQRKRTSVFFISIAEGRKIIFMMNKVKQKQFFLHFYHFEQKVSKLKKFRQKLITLWLVFEVIFRVYMVFFVSDM